MPIVRQPTTLSAIRWIGTVGPPAAAFTLPWMMEIVVERMFINVK